MPQDNCGCAAGCLNPLMEGNIPHSRRTTVSWHIVEHRPCTSVIHPVTSKEALLGTAAALASQSCSAIRTARHPRCSDILCIGIVPQVLKRSATGMIMLLYSLDNPYLIMSSMKPMAFAARLPRGPALMVFTRTYSSSSSTTTMSRVLLGNNTALSDSFNVHALRAKPPNHSRRCLLYAACQNGSIC